MSWPLRVPMLIKIWLCLSVFGPLHLIMQASSQQVMTHLMAIKQVDKRPLTVRARGEAMLARREQDQPAVTLPDFPTVVALHPKALPVMHEVFTSRLHSTTDLAAS